MFFQSMVRVRAGTRTDRGGNTVSDWTPTGVSRLELTGLSVQPTLQTERTDATRTSVLEGWQVFTAPGQDADVRSGDRMEYGGLLCEVIGEVGRWYDPITGSVHHVAWQMRRSTG